MVIDLLLFSLGSLSRKKMSAHYIVCLETSVIHLLMQVPGLVLGR